MYIHYMTLDEKIHNYELLPEGSLTPKKEPELSLRKTQIYPPQWDRFLNR